MKEYYLLELNNNKEWEISTLWSSHNSSNLEEANQWLLTNKDILPPIPNQYNGQILKAKLNHTSDGKLFDICDYRIERIDAIFYNEKWNLSFDCRKINHGHSYTLYEKNFDF